MPGYWDRLFKGRNYKPLTSKAPGVTKRNGIRALLGKSKAEVEATLKPHLQATQAKMRNLLTNTRKNAAKNAATNALLSKPPSAAAVANVTKRLGRSKIALPAIEAVGPAYPQPALPLAAVAAAPVPIVVPPPPPRNGRALPPQPPLPPQPGAAPATGIPPPPPKKKPNLVNIAELVAAAEAALKKQEAPQVVIDAPAVAAAAEAAAAGEPPVKPHARPGDRFLCDLDYTKQILSKKADIEEIHASRGKLGEGTYGFTTSAEVHMKTKGNGASPLMCIGALKTAKLTSPDLPSDVLLEMSIYARLAAAPCLAKGLFFKLQPGQLKAVMEHYIIDLDKLYTSVVFPMARVIGAAGHEKLTKGIMFQILTGLKEMHAANIIHRDFKPENALLAQEGAVYVTDYGLSLYNPYGFEYPQAFYYPTGTPTTQAPESILEGKFDARFDIWSAGASLGYFLTGKYHFDLWREGDRWMRSASEDKYSVRVQKVIAAANRNSYSAECIAFLRRLLSIDPRKRPTAVQALRDPWFGAMDLATAQAAVNRYIGQFIGTKTTSLVAGAKKKGNANAFVNTNISSYIRVEPAASSGTEWAPWVAGTDDASVNRKQMTLGKLFSLLWQPYNLPMPVVLHAIELFERVRNASGPGDNIVTTMATVAVIAAKLYELQTDVRKLKRNLLVGIPALKADDINTEERRIVRVLGGDLFAQPDGFAAQFVKECIERRQSKPSGAYTVLRAVLSMMVYAYSTTGSKEVKSYVDIAETYVNTFMTMVMNPDSKLSFSKAEGELLVRIQNSKVSLNFMVPLQVPAFNAATLEGLFNQKREEKPTAGQAAERILLTAQQIQKILNRSIA